MKKLLIFNMFLLSTLCMSAEEFNALVLHLASGSKVSIMLDQKPIVTFADEELVISTQSDVIRYQATDVSSFTYTSDSDAGIEVSSHDATSFSITGDVFRATCLVPNTKVFVYTVDGTQIISGKTDSNGNLSLPLPREKGKIYIVKSSVANFKIIRP